MLHTAGLATTQWNALLPVLHSMRTEIMYGQYLELLGTGRTAPRRRLRRGENRMTSGLNPTTTGSGRP